MIDQENVVHKMTAQLTKKIPNNEKLITVSEAKGVKK